MPEYYRTVERAAINPTRVDERLKHLASTDDAHYTVTQAYALPRAVHPDYVAPERDDPAEGRTLRVPMQTHEVGVAPRVDDGRLDDGITVSRHLETVTIDPSRNTHNLITLVARDLAGLTFTTERAYRDSPDTWRTILGKTYQDKFRDEFLEERVWGLGGHEPLGVMNAGDALIEIEKETGQAADTIIPANVLKMRARCWGYKRAVWLAGFNTVDQLLPLSVAGADGGSVQLWTPGSDEDGTPDLLAGRPCYFVDHCSALGDRGDLICVNWSQYLDGYRGGTNVAESIHVRFLAAERAFRFIVMNDGAPWWVRTLVPRRAPATHTMSPYVTLQARA
jgi:HK97 family phage major capsid protein